MQNVYKDIEEFSLFKKGKVLIVSDDMIADMINNKKLNPVVTELFIRDIKLNFSMVFITQSYFKVPKEVRFNTTRFFIMKIPNKRELQQFALNQSSDIGFKNFMKIYEKYTGKPCSFLVNDTTLPFDNPLRFRKNFWNKYIIKSWQLIIRLRMKKYNMILIGKLQKYQPYHQAKLISMNILQVKLYYLLIKSK